MKPLHQKEIEAAAGYLYEIGGVVKSPLELDDTMYPDLDIELYLKREDQQPVKSFKIRGAFNAIGLLSDRQKQSGVVCASAGNHAQGFAIACKTLGVKGTVFMPENAPDVKVEATRKFGGEYIDIQLIGDNFDEASEASQEFCSSQEASYIHPFDDESVIIGASTIGYEIFKQMDEIGKAVDYVLAPVGGGGLLAGTIHAKNVYSPSTQIIGVEPKGHSSMRGSLEKGRLITINNPDSAKFADGTAVSRVGEITFGVAQQDNTHIISVGQERLGKYLDLVSNKLDISLEPSGCLSVAAIGQEIETFKGKVVVSILSGANIDESRIKKIPELSERHNQYRINERKPIII